MLNFFNFFANNAISEHANIQICTDEFAESFVDFYSKETNQSTLYDLCLSSYEKYKETLSMLDYYNRIDAKQIIESLEVELKSLTSNALLYKLMCILSQRNWNAGYFFNCTFNAFLIEELFKSVFVYHIPLLKNKTEVLAKDIAQITMQYDAQVNELNEQEEIYLVLKSKNEKMNKSLHEANLAMTFIHAQYRKDPDNNETELEQIETHFKKVRGDYRQHKDELKQKKLKTRICRNKCLELINKKVALVNEKSALIDLQYFLVHLAPKFLNEFRKQLPQITEDILKKIESKQPLVEKCQDYHLRQIDDSELDLCLERSFLLDEKQKRAEFLIKKELLLQKFQIQPQPPLEKPTPKWAQGKELSEEEAQKRAEFQRKQQMLFPFLQKQLQPKARPNKSQNADFLATREIIRQAFPGKAIHS